MIHLFPASGQASAFTIIALERFKKSYSRRGAGIFGFWRVVPIIGLWRRGIPP
jgi:hypothetical protein